jgi:hypothetical protein
VNQLDQIQFFTYVDSLIDRIEADNVFANTILENDENVFKQSSPITRDQDSDRSASDDEEKDEENEIDEDSDDV